VTNSGAEEEFVETQQVRIRADVMPSLKAIADRRRTTLTEIVSVAVVEWLEKHDPTWRDTMTLRRVEDRLGEVWQAITDANQTLQDLKDEENNDYEDRYANPDEAKALEETRSSEHRKLEHLIVSRDRLVAAIVALSGDREETVREKFTLTHGTPYVNAT